MTSTCVVEQLSGYLDGEVSPEAQIEIKEHLGGCPECRHHLEGLRAVINRLENLERVMPPITVSQAVHQSAKALSGSRAHSDSWERLARFLAFESSVLPFLALVVALAGIALVFVSALERSQASRSRLIWIGQPEEAAESPAIETQRVVAGRVFDRIEDSWIERGVSPADLPDRRGQANSVQLTPYSELYGRVLLRIDGEVVEVVFEASNELSN